MAEIHIGRGTTNLGVFKIEEVKAGLSTGRFLLSDVGWKEGMEGWKPLSEFEELAEAPTHDLFSGLEDEPFGASPEVAIPGEGLPWDRRESIGWFKAYIDTVKLVLTQPAQAFQAMHQEGGLSSPFLFALIGGAIGGIAGLIYAASLIQSPWYLAQIEQLPPQIKAMLATKLGLGAVLRIPIQVALGVFIASAVTHVCLMLVGGAKRPFETTFRVICYCMGSTNLLLIIPLCGSAIAGIWGLIVEVIGLARAHDIQTGRALTAVLLPLICCCAFIVAAVFAGVALRATH